MQVQERLQAVLVGHQASSRLTEMIDDDVLIKDIARIEARLDAEIPEATKTMDELLARLRTIRIVSRPRHGVA